MIVMICMSVVATVLVIHLGYKKTKMPKWIETLFFDCLGRCVGLERWKPSGNDLKDVLSNEVKDDHQIFNGHLVNQMKSEAGDTGAEDSEVNGVIRSRENALDCDRFLFPLVAEISRSMAVTRNHFEQKAENDEMQGKWQRVAMIVDRLLLYSFAMFAIVVTVTLAIYLVIMSEKDYQTLTKDE